jgi:hypothetical protein
LELAVGSVEAVGVGATCCAALATDFDGAVEQDRDVGFATLRRRVEHRAQLVDGHAAAEALVGERRATVAIADHVTARAKCRLDHLGEVLRPIGGKDEHLCEW